MGLLVARCAISLLEAGMAPNKAAAMDSVADWAVAHEVSFAETLSMLVMMFGAVREVCLTKGFDILGALHAGIKIVEAELVAQGAVIPS